MTKYDIKRDSRHCYRAKNTAWQLVEVPRQQFIAWTDMVIPTPVTSTPRPWRLSSLSPTRSSS